MCWSAAQYLNTLNTFGSRCNGMQTEVEKRMRQLYLPNENEEISHPCLVVDSEENVLVWFLPGLLSSKRQVGGN